MGAEYKMTSAPIMPESATPQARQVLEKAKAQVGFIPNMYASMAVYPDLLDTYLDGYKRFRATSDFSPVEQEVIFLAISRFHGCEYCVAAHSMIAAKSDVPASVTSAIRDNCKVEDKRLGALSRFVVRMVESRGLPSNKDVREFLDAGYTERNILGIILAISVKTISNYANHLTHPKLDPPFAGYAWSRDGAKRQKQPEFDVLKNAS